MSNSKKKKKKNALQPNRNQERFIFQKMLSKKNKIN